MQKKNYNFPNFGTIVAHNAQEQKAMKINIVSKIYKKNKQFEI